MFVLLLTGALVGATAHLLRLDTRTLTLVGACALAVVGSVVGGFAARALFDGDDDGYLQPTAVIGAVIGAVVVLIVYLAVDRRTLRD